MEGAIGRQRCRALSTGTVWPLSDRRIVQHDFWLLRLRFFYRHPYSVRPLSVCGRHRVRVFLQCDIRLPKLQVVHFQNKGRLPAGVVAVHCCIRRHSRNGDGTIAGSGLCRQASHASRQISSVHRGSNLDGSNFSIGLLGAQELLVRIAIPDREALDLSQRRNDIFHP